MSLRYRARASGRFDRGAVASQSESIRPIEVGDLVAYRRRPKGSHGFVYAAPAGYQVRIDDREPFAVPTFAEAMRAIGFDQSYER